MTILGKCNPYEKYLLQIVNVSAIVLYVGSFATGL